MASNRQVTVPVPIADLNRMILLLAGTVLATSIAVFCVVDITLHQGVMQALLISVIPNIIASVFIYIAIYFSLSRVDSLRQRAAQQEMVEAITSSIRSIIPATPAAAPAQTSSSAFARQHIRPEQLMVIQRFLDAICNFSTTLSGNLDLRLYLHLADKKEGVLRPVCVARGRTRAADYDHQADLPYRGPEARVFVVAKAMNQRRVVAEDLPANHSEWYSDELKTKISANLKCVIAAPIESYMPGVDAGPLGVIAIDSTSANCAELGFTDPSGEISSKFDIMLTSCSRALYQVLTM
jgi:hypothetical protein